MLHTEMVEKPKCEVEADFVGKYTTPLGLSVSDDLFVWFYFPVVVLMNFMSFIAVYLWNTSCCVL